MSYQHYTVPADGYENPTQLYTGLPSKTNAIFYLKSYEVEVNANNSGMYDNRLSLVFTYLYDLFEFDMYLAQL